MKIRDTVYEMEKADSFLVTVHLDTGCGLSLHTNEFGIHMDVTQAQDIIDDLQKGIERIRKYREVFKDEAD